MEARPSTSQATEKAFSFISNGWREVKDSAGEDLRLMRARASSFKNLADRELENFLYPSPLCTNRSLPSADDTNAELGFVNRIRRVYSSPEFTRDVMERSSHRSRIRIDLSSISNAIVSEVDDRKWFPDCERDRPLCQRGEEDDEGNEWDPIRTLKTGFRELEQMSRSKEVLGNLKGNKFVQKVKSSLASICKDPHESKEVPPLDVHELLAYLAKQSGSFSDQLGFRRDSADRRTKVVDALSNQQEDLLKCHSLPAREAPYPENENVKHESDLRIASMLQSTSHQCEDGFWTDAVKHDSPDKKHHVAIITTASLPWMTGTAVNPLFRAAYLAKSKKQDVTLLVPWLCKSEQELIYPNNLTFSSPEEQEAYIRSWLEERAGFKTDFRIAFYPGKFSKERRSIIPSGDTSQFISSKEADIAILEEPEHLNWYHHGRRWTDKFNHVVGVVHTNYVEYIKREKNGAIQAFLVKHINNWVTRAHCHKVLRLSGATQELPKSVICNVHGVNPKFLKVGEKIAAERDLGQHIFSDGAYFLGKMVWAKGYKELIDLLAKHKNDLEGFKLDVYGNGQDSHEVRSAAKKLDLNLNFLNGRDHSDDSLHGYKVFINPSVSDVLCTASAEALAMGKFVICADHPSNDFFREFPNCLTYRTSEEFVSRVKEAFANEPLPLTPEQRYNLSWEAATQRFMEHSELDKVLGDNNEECMEGVKPNKMRIKKSVSMPNLSDVVDRGLAFAHNCLTGNEILRLSTGAIPGTRDYDKQHCIDLHLLPPQVQNPTYGW